MMKTRKGYPVYPLTVAQKFSFVLSAILSECGSTEYWHKPDNWHRSGLGCTPRVHLQSI